MLKFDILNDESLEEVLNKFVSALLPHSNYDASMYSTVLNTVFRYIHLNEMNMEYYVLFDLFNKLNSLQASFAGEFKPMLKKQNLLDYLEVNISTLITKKPVRVKEWLEFEGISSNLDVEETKYKACQVLANRVIQLYDLCFEMEIDTKEILNSEPALKRAFLTHSGTICVNTQKDKISTGNVDWWLKDATSSITEIQQRLNDAQNDTVISINSLLCSNELLSDLKSSYLPIADYGIPPIDGIGNTRGTPMLRHRLVVVVGKENIGKTKFAIDKAVNVLLEGKKVLFMCGETTKSKIYCSILVNYIWKKTKFKTKMEHILGTVDPGDKLRCEINNAILEISQSGLLILSDAFDYGKVYAQLQGSYEEHEWDACFIDHSCALVGTAGDGSLKSKVDALADAVRRFRKDYPVYIMVTSHPSTTAKDSDSRGKVTSDSPTKGSQNLSTDADEVFYLRDDENLRKQNLILLENTKRRDAARIDDYIKLRKDFSVSAFIYDKADQISDTSAATSESEKDALIKQVSNLYASVSDDDEEDLDDSMFADE